MNLNDLSNSRKRSEPVVAPVSKFRQVPADVAPPQTRNIRKNAFNVMLDTTTPSDVTLPTGLTPTSNVNGSSGVSEFFLLDDGKTGVLALGSFEDSSFDGFQQTLLSGLTNLKNAGATQLIVDVVSQFVSARIEP